MPGDVVQHRGDGDGWFLLVSSVLSYVLFISGKLSVRCSPGIAGLVLAAADVPSGPLHRGGVEALLRGPRVSDCGSGEGAVSQLDYHELDH